MFWSLFWWMYAESELVTSLIWWGDIIFNTYSLQSTEVITQNITMEDFPNIEYTDYNIPRWDWKGFTSKFFRNRNIKVSWILKSDSNLSLNVLIDSFKKYMSQTSGIFKYKVQWEYRQISATCTDLKIDRKHYNITFIPFELTLTTTDSFFYLSSNLTATDSGTTSPFTIEINNEWTAVSLPQVYMTFSWVTAPTSVSLALNGRTLIYTATTIVNSDILVFDCLNKVVTLNGVNKEYSWTFPEMITGTNSLVFTINSAFTCAYSILYRKNFL